MIERCLVRNWVASRSITTHLMAQLEEFPAVPRLMLQAIQLFVELLEQG
jgi:hypothetical protein